MGGFKHPFKPSSARRHLLGNLRATAQPPRRAGVWLVNADGAAAPRRVTVLRNDSTSSASDPRWSPDGRLLALLSDHERAPQVYVLSADGAEPRGASRQRILVARAAIAGEIQRLLK